MHTTLKPYFSVQSTTYSEGDEVDFEMEMVMLVEMVTERIPRGLVMAMASISLRWP
jgi:hypothetical protein